MGKTIEASTKLNRVKPGSPRNGSMGPSTDPEKPSVFAVAKALTICFAAWVLFLSTRFAAGFVAGMLLELVIGSVTFAGAPVGVVCGLIVLARTSKVGLSVEGDN